jgi:3-oxoacyl-[acyl-carrier-protein] synthase II
LPETDPSRRAVVTGLGAVMPIGNDFPTYWSNLVAGVTGTRTIQGFDASAFEVRIAAEVLGFDPTAAMDAKMARRMTRFIHLGMAAGKEAVADSGIDFASMSQEQRDRVGVVMNTGGGGIEAIIDGTHVHDQKGPRFVSAFAVPALSGSMGAALLSMEWGLTGPVMTQVAACATSVIAFHDALRLIQTGECDVVLAGGSEAPVVPMGVAALANMGALSKRNDSPETASRPFDGTRDGFVLGEGAGLVVIESLAHALERGATPLAEVLGGALTADAFHISAPEPTGRGQSRAMTNALRNSGVAPDEIDYIVAHGTATPLNDVTETRAIKTAYGAHAKKVAISSPKSMIGHLVGAAGIASALAAIGAIRDQVIPPTANLRTPDPECDLDYVPLTARKTKVETVAVHGFGFGGQNAVAIFRRLATRRRAGDGPPRLARSVALGRAYVIRVARPPPDGECHLLEREPIVGS